jgi:hypothetical protein
MLYPTVTELTRGTAHPECQVSQTTLVALSPGLELPVANTRWITESGASHSDFRCRPNAPLRLARRDEWSGAVQPTEDAFGAARWPSHEAA